MRNRPTARRNSAAVVLRMTKEDIRRAGGRFAEGRYWLAWYVWRETADTAERLQRGRPIQGPGTAIVRALDEREVRKTLRRDLPASLTLVDVVFAEPWGDAGTMVFRGR